MQVRYRGGFTLIELLVVILIITILGAVVGVKLAGKPHEARRAAALAQLENLRTALKLYHMDNGVYPAQRQGLQALVEASSMDPRPRRFPEGGYLDRRELPRDPWGNAYVYLIPGTSGETYEILSYGRDGRPGGDGEDSDISSAGNTAP
jgi:general secretion pathway protein G